MAFLGLGTFQWMTGTVWTVPSTIGEYLRDINGTTITVGATVKLVGTVVAINQDPHYGTIQVRPNNPNGSYIIFQGGGQPVSNYFPVPNPQNPEPPNVYGFEPLQLIVGS